MENTATIGEAVPAAEEARLARAAAKGDGGAFALLYERYEQRVFNLAYRIVGSEDDAADAVQEAFLSAMRTSRLADHEPAFGSYLFTATRNACHDLMDRRRHTRPSEAIPAEPQGDEVRVANTRLPESQREALALRELEELSYDEIAAIMEINRNTVSQLISRARINLRDELGGTALASVAAPSPECERALPLIAMRDDEQLDPASRDAAWLDAHLAGCDRCGLAVEAMRDASASYRAWAPIASAPWLRKETMARAAELADADWSEAIAAAPARTRGESLPDTPSAKPGGTGRRKLPRRRVTLTAGLAALLLLAGLAAVLARDDPTATPAGPAAGAASGPSIGAAPKTGKTKGDAAKANARTIVAPGAGPAPAPTGSGAPSEPASPNGSPGKTTVQPPQQTSAPNSQPAPTSTPAPQPATAPTPVTEQPPPGADALSVVKEHLPALPR
jgi:RNA polymerase sigma factor (sigma-70 family)